MSVDLDDDRVDGDADDVRTAQRNHFAELAVHREFDRLHAVARAEHAVVGAGGAAALDMAEHHRAAFDAGDLLNFLAEHFADAAEAHVAERIEFLARR